VPFRALYRAYATREKRLIAEVITEILERHKIDTAHAVEGEKGKTIVISEYFYAQKHRETLASSPIRTIMEKNYLAHKDVIFNTISGWKKYRNCIDKIPVEQDASDITAPYWNNGWFSGADAISLYCALAHNNPRYYVECGSGNSTKFAAHAIKNHRLRTKIISIDPQPRAEINSLCHKLYRCGLEAMDIEFFRTLTEEDILLIDNSHRAFPNSDVTVFFTEILPILPSGILYALHDIFLPYDYPVEWIEQEVRSYNEQYMLASYVLGGKMGDILELPLYFLSKKQEIQEHFESVLGYQTEGGLFWMRKKPLTANS
jgi:hypothetical protein